MPERDGGYKARAQTGFVYMARTVLMMAVTLETAIAPKTQSQQGVHRSLRGHPVLHGLSQPHKVLFTRTQLLVTPNFALFAFPNLGVVAAFSLSLLVL